MIPNLRLLIGRFIVLLLAQVWVFNHIELFGYCNPAFYLLFVLVYRFNQDQFTLILLSFSLGIGLDLLNQGAGSHTLATVSIAYLRPLIARFSFGINDDQPYAMYYGTRLYNRLLYLGLMIFMHQLLFYWVEYFSFAHLVAIFRNTLIGSLFTFLLLLTTLNLIRKEA